MTIKAHLDFEWRSALDIRKVGLHRQIEHRSTMIWCASWRIGNTGPVNRWRPGWPDPVPLLEHVAAGRTVCSHNTSAERIPWNNLIRRRIAPHWPEMTREQMNCTLARCSALAIPPSLEMAAIALRLPQQKDTDGGRTMKQMAKPRTRKVCSMCGGNGLDLWDGAHCDGCDGCGEIYTWWDEPEKIERLMLYCDGDLLTETGVDEKVPELSAREREIWLLNQEINDRGVALDIPLIHRALSVVDYARTKLDAQMADITSGYVKKCSETKKIVAYLNARGVPCISVAKDEQEDLLVLSGSIGDDLAEEVIELRKAASVPVTKFKSMLSCAGEDGRARGLLFYHGASSGRESGRLIQPQNLYRTDAERDGANIERTIQLLQTHADAAAAYEAIYAIVEDPMRAIVKCTRPMFIASPGHKFRGADLANIEGRGAAWVAGEAWKLDAFRAYDAKTGPDLYVLAYAKAFGLPVAFVKKWMRQIGKVMELSLQYQGSVGAFLNMGKNYGLKPAELVEPVRAAVGEVEWARVLATYAKAKNKMDLPADQWTACKIIVNGWRAGHPKITQGWWDCQDAAIEAVDNPMIVIPVLDGKVRYMFARDFLWCSLPNGRVLAYCRPHVVTTTEEVIGKDGEPYKRDKRTVWYEGYDGERKKWGKFNLYGGMQFNHIVQGFARDIMFDGAFEARRQGYPIVLDIHDELLTDCAPGHGSDKELEEIMSIERPWAPGLPLAAAAWEDTRYAK